MPHSHAQPGRSSSRDNDGPEVFVDEHQTARGNHSGDALAAGEPPSPKDQPGRSAPVPGRTIPRLAVTGIVAMLALSIGSLGGYVVGQRTHDVSVSGQVSYACALIANVRQSHRTPKDWGEILQDQGYGDAAAASELLGSLVAFSKDREEVREFGPVLNQLHRLDPEALTSAIEATHRVCENR